MPETIPGLELGVEERLTACMLEAGYTNFNVELNSYGVCIKTENGDWVQDPVFMLAWYKAGIISGYSPTKVVWNSICLECWWNVVKDPNHTTMDTYDAAVICDHDIWEAISRAREITGIVIHG